MVRKPLILDHSEYDLNNVIADIEEIRKFNPQRHEMEQLTAIVYEDQDRGVCVGYKDLAEDEFWVRGHMPGTPLMPGVIMCEAAAQLSAYFARKHRVLDGELVGFGGLEDVRFRGIVRPGDRFVIMAKKLSSRSNMIKCDFQGFVNEELVVTGQIKGIVLPISLLQESKEVA